MHTVMRIEPIYGMMAADEAAQALMGMQSAGGKGGASTGASESAQLGDSLAAGEEDASAAKQQKSEVICSIAQILFGNEPTHYPIGCQQRFLKEGRRSHTRDRVCSVCRETFKCSVANLNTQDARVRQSILCVPLPYRVMQIPDDGRTYRNSRGAGFWSTNDGTIFRRVGNYVIFFNNVPENSLMSPFLYLELLTDTFRIVLDNPQQELTEFLSRLTNKSTDPTTTKVQQLKLLKYETVVADPAQSTTAKPLVTKRDDTKILTDTMSISENGNVIKGEFRYSMNSKIFEVQLHTINDIELINVATRALTEGLRRMHNQKRTSATASTL